MDFFAWLSVRLRLTRFAKSPVEEIHTGPSFGHTQMWEGKAAR